MKEIKKEAQKMKEQTKDGFDVEVNKKMYSVFVWKGDKLLGSFMIGALISKGILKTVDEVQQNETM